MSAGEDGPSQMALEDIAMFRSIPGSTVFYPSDAVSCERAVELAANTPGICFIRTSRPNVPVIYENNEVFNVGKAKVTWILVCFIAWLITEDHDYVCCMIYISQNNVYVKLNQFCDCISH